MKTDLVFLEMLLNQLQIHHNVYFNNHFFLYNINVYRKSDKKKELTPIRNKNK